jgi:hypothetical protein
MGSGIAGEKYVRAARDSAVDKLASSPRAAKSDPSMTCFFTMCRYTGYVELERVEKIPARCRSTEFQRCRSLTGHGYTYFIRATQQGPMRTM